MIDERDLLERGLQGLEPAPGLAERVLARRDRKHRNQRVAAGGVGVAIVIAGIVAFASVAGEGDADHTPATPAPSATVSEQPEQRTFTQQVLTFEGEPGIHLFDVGTGEATPLPEEITDVALDNWGLARYQASPDGSQLLFMGADRAGRSQAFLASIDGRSIRQLTDEPYGAEAASYSPDGGRIVYIALGGTRRLSPADLMVMEIATGETDIVVHAEGSEFPYGRESISSPRFAPDGQAIVYTDGVWGRLRSMSVQGGKPSLLIDEDAWDPVFSPDGTTIAFYRYAMFCLGTCNHMGDEPQIWFADADGDNQRPFAGGGTYAPSWSPDGTRIAFVRRVRPDELIDGVPVGSTGPGSDNLEGQVLVLDRTTGAITAIVGVEAPLTWLDDRTLIVNVSSSDSSPTGS